MKIATSPHLLRALTRHAACRRQALVVSQHVPMVLSAGPTLQHRPSPMLFVQRAHLSSHDDFAPKLKVAVDSEDRAIEMIKDHVKNNRIMLYMKGNPSMPMCGFSARVVQVLQAEEVDFASVNVLDYPEIREGIKKFSDWPTIPQLYVGGEFIGGCDIVTAMHESGELKELLQQEKK